MCDSDSLCKSDLRSYALSGFSSKKTLTVVGVAKDGHLIYGPYKQTGELFTCSSLDICNGFSLDDGSYGYVYSTTYPYTVNCFGPGVARNMVESCSTNTCSSSSSNSQMLQSGISALLISAAVFALMTLN